MNGNKHGEGRGEKNCQIFQTANRVPCNKLLGSCWKFYWKKRKLFIYIWTCNYYCYYRIYIYIYTYIYLCKKHCHILHWVYKNNDSFLSFLSSIFHSKIHKHPTFKMNRDEQEGQKFEAKKFAIISLFLHLDAWMQ